jgi:hypothetical protein
MAPRRASRWRLHRTDNIVAFVHFRLLLRQPLSLRCVFVIFRDERIRVLRWRRGLEHHHRRERCRWPRHSLHHTAIGAGRAPGQTLRASCFWSVGRVWHNVYVEVGFVGDLRVARVVFGLRRWLACVLCRSSFWCEERVAFSCCSSAVGVLVHERRVHVGRRRLLVCQTVVAVDPLARWSVMRLNYGSGDGGHHTHVRVSSAPCADFAICRRRGATSPAWEYPSAAVFLLSSVYTAECEDHDGDCNHAKHDA